MNDYTRRKLERAGRRRKARSAALRRGAMLRPTPEQEDPLAKVAFGSPEARELAESEDMTWEDFAASTVTPSGVEGYLVGDVQAVRREMG